MLKIFLVEDESIVREGLRDNIPWQQYGYKFVGEASDGEMALPLIQKTRPDVLLTDIRMPFMDGLSLSRIVHQEFPDMKHVQIMKDNLSGDTKIKVSGVPRTFTMAAALFMFEHMGVSLVGTRSAGKVVEHLRLRDRGKEGKT